MSGNIFDSSTLYTCIFDVFYVSIVGTCILNICSKEHKQEDQAEDYEWESTVYEEASTSQCDSVEQQKISELEENLKQREECERLK